MAQDEFERIARIKRAFRRAGHTGVVVDIGDDAAVLAQLEGRAVLSVDANVEGVHFRRDWLALDVIAARAFTAALSDLAAMGAKPRAALCAFILPSTFGDADLDLLVAGFARASERYGCPIVGGNLARGQELSLTTTVIGEADERVLTRAGAQPGDRIWLTGDVGAAALGVQLLERGRGQDGPAFVARYAEPHARIAEGLAVLTSASAGIDVSDGVLQDLGHLCEASGVAADVWADALPLAPGLRELAAEHGFSALELALCGGDDYELLYTAPATHEGPGTAIGVIREAGHAGPACVVLDRDGQPLSFRARGYRHFSG